MKITEIENVDIYYFVGRRALVRHWSPSVYHFFAILAKLRITSGEKDVWTNDNTGEVI